MTDKRDLVILGGGLVGMTLALAAARQGISSHVVDKALPEELTRDGVDGRASAISTADKPPKKRISTSRASPGSSLGRWSASSSASTDKTPPAAASPNSSPHIPRSLLVPPRLSTLALVRRKAVF